MVAVCGVKGMGKSSMARLLANHLMSCCDSEVKRGARKTGKEWDRQLIPSSNLMSVLASDIRNTNYQEVMYLDTDCGQAEFTPPGLISLVRLRRHPVIGPPFTHMRQPEASHFLVGGMDLRFVPVELVSGASVLSERVKKTQVKARGLLWTRDVMCFVIAP